MFTRIADTAAPGPRRARRQSDWIPMLRRDELERIGAALTGASAATETHFVGLGERLEASTAILETLSQTFGRLTGELASDALRQATDELQHIAERVAALAEAQQDERGAIERLAGLIAKLDGRLTRM